MGDEKHLYDLFIAGIYFTFVMLICAISVSVTMLVLCVYHQASSHPASACTPVPPWVSTTPVSLSVSHSLSYLVSFPAHKTAESEDTEMSLLTDRITCEPDITLKTLLLLNSSVRSLH